MRTAKVFADLSYARNLKVGAVIVKDNRIIAEGYNGTPAGADNECENKVKLHPAEIDTITDRPVYFEDGVHFYYKTKLTVLHAEANSIAKLAKTVESGDGAILFTTHSPCIECAKLIYQSGIKAVYYQHTYRTQNGLEFLRENGVHVEQMEADIHP